MKSAIINADLAFDAGDVDAAGWHARLADAKALAEDLASMAPETIAFDARMLVEGFADLPAAPVVEGHVAYETLDWRLSTIGIECLRNGTEVVVRAEYGG